MNRKRFTFAALGAGIGLPLAAVELGRASKQLGTMRLPRRPLPIPVDGLVRTAVVIGPGVNVIDLAGPWEVFQDAAVAGGPGRFELFTVADGRAPVEASGGLKLSPTFTFDSAPQPHVIVVPAHQSSSRTLCWLRSAGRRADLVMSVCTGAYVLAEAGLLDRRTATTHHQSYDDFAATFPQVRVVRARRFVEHEHVATAGGLTAGVDLALRVVERYLGREAANLTAQYMEYERRTVIVS